MSTCGRQLDTSDHTTKEVGRHIKFKKSKEKAKKKRKEKQKPKKKREEKNKTPWGFHLVISDPHSLSKCQREFKLVKAHLARSSHPV